MLSETTCPYSIGKSRLSRQSRGYAGKNLNFRKYYLIIVSLVLAFFEIQAQSGAWTKKKDMPTPRIVTEACIVNDKIYVIGGTNVNLLNFAANEVYDPSTDTWEGKKPLPTPKAFASTATVDGIIYVIGGGYPDTTSTVNAYDPMTDSWTTKDNMLSERFAAHSAVVDGIIYNIAGNHYDKNLEAYDPKTEQWTRKKDIPETWGIILITAYNGLIYAFGGGFDTSLSTVYAYDPKTDTWTKKKDMPTPRISFQTYLVDGKIYAIGGMTKLYGEVLAAVEVYDPVSDTWVKKEDMPFKRTMFAGAVVNGKIYIIGGTSDWIGSDAEEIWEYNPAFPTNIDNEFTYLTEFVLYQNYPNPFNPSTIIQYGVPQAGSSQTSISSMEFVSLKIYDVLGNEVAILVNEEKSAGTYEVTWNAENLSSGVYYYQLRANNFVETKKMLLLK